MNVFTKSYFAIIYGCTNCHLKMDPFCVSCFPGHPHPRFQHVFRFLPVFNLITASDVQQATKQLRATFIIK
ncbi:hypothetical protein M5D96_000769 [Drosophila gunungcola]|uniref:Uncharacterized protein n=1 Tax=Drosophila gunungcola TaxID=103775 RepID=A0A9P9YWW6_9MUSC|nr:hypothetical protein M5D96_000769 [Drosophila gunungcola]